MSASNRQFDPVAAASVSALDATERTLRQAQSQLSAPQLPAQAQAFQGIRSVVTNLSEVSPLNVLAQGDAPIPLPGQQGQGGLPSPDQLLPSGQQGIPRPPVPGQSQQSGGSGGSQGSSSGGSPDAEGSNDARRNRQ